MDFTRIIRQCRDFISNDLPHAISFMYLMISMEDTLEEFQCKSKTRTLQSLIDELEQNGIPCHKVKSGSSAKYAIVGTCLFLEGDDSPELIYRSRSVSADTINMLDFAKYIKDNYPRWKSDMEELCRKHEEEFLQISLDKREKDDDKTHYRNRMEIHLDHELSLYHIFFPGYRTYNELRAKLAQEGFDFQIDTPVHLNNCDIIIQEYDIKCIPHSYPKIELLLTDIELTKEMIEEIDDRIPSWIEKHLKIEKEFQKRKKIRELNTRAIQSLVKKKMKELQYEYTLEVYKPWAILTIKAANDRFASSRLPYDPLKCSDLIEQLHQAVQRLNTIPQDVLISVYPSDKVWTKP